MKIGIIFNPRTINFDIKLYLYYTHSLSTTKFILSFLLTILCTYLYYALRAIYILEKKLYLSNIPLKVP